MSLPILTHIIDYNKAITNKNAADKALAWLQGQYQKTNPNVLKEFERIWRGGHSSGQPLAFKDVAHYYDPKNPNHGKAIQYLDSHVAAPTLQMFDDIWFGRKEPDPLPAAPAPPTPAPPHPQPGVTALPILTHLQDYNRSVTNKANADKALTWLQSQYQQTNLTALKEFDTLWRGGHAATQPLDFKNVAHYFDAKNPNHTKAIHYLDSHISGPTLQMFDDIWFGRKQP